MEDFLPCIFSLFHKNVYIQLKSQLHRDAKTQWSEVNAPNRAAFDFPLLQKQLIWVFLGYFAA